MNWQTFIRKLEKDFRLNGTELQNKTSIDTSIFYKLKKGITKKPNQATIKRLEEGLNIKIDDSNPSNIVYSNNLFNENIELFNVEGNEFPVISQILLANEIFNNQNIIGTMIFPYPKKENCFILIFNTDAFGIFSKGDKILIDMDAEVKNGNMIACRLKTGEQLVKYFRRLPEEYVQLYSASFKENPLAIKMNEIDTIYRVVQHLRNI
jgi:SOS-response transcriptional repressor LexA